MDDFIKQGLSYCDKLHQEDPERVYGMPFGGKEVFVRELSDFFWKHREYRHDNEPGHQAPYQFAFAGRPDLTARIVRETIRNSYFATSHAMRGNDDCGQMSAWYLFSTFGFYPFDGFSATYVLGAPQIPEATLELPNGRRLHITAPGLSEEAMYVERVELNGKALKGPTISHAELMQGGELVFHMTGGTRSCASANTRREAIYCVRKGSEQER